MRAMRRAAALVLVLPALACAPRAVRPEAPPALTVAEAGRRGAPKVAEPRAWADDVLASIRALRQVPDAEKVCQVLAVIEQESGFDPDPAVPGLGKIALRELEAKASKVPLVGQAALDELLGQRAPGDRRTFAERLRAARTERDLDRVFRDLLALYRGRSPLVFGAASALGDVFGRSFEELNPITTAGSMQVSVRFAEELAEARGRERELVREELYTRRGGVLYGTARLLGHEASYETPLHRFADYNAGLYASRNAAFQSQLARLTGRKLAPDGDLLRYDAEGDPAGEDSATLAALLAFRATHAPELSEWRIRRDARLEKTRGFEETRTWEAVRVAYRSVAKEEPAYARLPEVALKSPKLSKGRSTAWFAKAVEARYRRCLARAR